MKKKGLLVITALLVAALLSVGCSSGSGTPAEKQEVKIAVSSWIGYAPLYVALEKGFFEDHGVTVDLQMIQSVADRRTALAAKKIDAFASTVDTHVMSAAAGIDVVQVLALDDSYGGDGIVSTKEINSLQDLKGKTIALHTGGGASYFWLNYLLNNEGMSMSDMVVKDMSAGDAGAAFVAGKVDAAVTWEPWLTKARDTDFGKVLIASDETPGIIVDTIGFRGDFIEEHPEAVEGVVKAWYDAVEFAAENPDEANPIMAEAMDQTVEEFEATLPTVKFYGAAENQEYFGEDGKSGFIREVSEKAADLWLEEKLIEQKPDIDALIDGSFVK